MEPRRWRLGGDVVRRTIALDLIDAIERDVESVAAFVLDDRDLDGAFADEHLLHAAIDAHTMLEMNHVITWLERGEAFERATSHVATCAPEAPFTSEDFVIGKNPIAVEARATRRNHEAAIEDSNRKTGRRHVVVVEQLVESFRLSSVVAKYYGRDAVGDDLLEALDVASDFLGRAKRERD